jgi:hypothetical protein
MNCIEFRRLYNRWLDARNSSPLLPEAVRHVRSCSACGKYAAAMLQVDEGLQHIPDVPLPEGLFEFSGSPVAHAPGRGGEHPSRFIGRGGAFAISALLAWSFSLLVPPQWQFAVQFLLVSGSMVVFAVTSLRPRFIG